MGTYGTYGQQADNTIAQLTTDKAGLTAQVASQTTLIAQLRARIAELENPTPTPTPTPTTRQWISGACSVEPDTITGGAFGTWRGEAATAYRFWLSPKSNMLLAGYYFQDKGFSAWSGGILDYAIGGPTNEQAGTGGVWARAAAGNWDDVWRQQCQQIHANWGSARRVHLSMAHELSGTWYEWSVRGDVANFKAAWRRYAAIVKTELKDKGRDVKIVLNLALGQEGAVAFYPGDDVVDIIGGDTYDQWQPTSTGHVLNESDWSTYTNRVLGDGSPAGVDALSTFAAQHGKPISIPEWGLSDGGRDAYMDNPFWIGKMNDFFRRKAPVDKWNPGPGEVALECIFSDAGYELEIYPNTSKNPQAVAKYKALTWGS